jgi:alpha-amylase
MKKNISIFILFILNYCSIFGQKNLPTSSKGEIMYHLCQRSFYDSNGDLNGDLNGLREKLDYLQELGITSILLLPLYEADCYHNYFANNFEQIDPEFGTMQDYLALVKDVHKRGMKIYLDMETQYVAEKHAWWKEAVGNPQSPFSDYLLFEDAAHKTPSTIIFGLRGLSSFDGSFIKITTVNLKSKKVFDYNCQLFAHFIDPNKDGKFDDGADGFRLDHAMDNLDGKPELTNLFSAFWSPLSAYLKTINPQIKIIAEQADWKDFGFEYFKKAGVDRMFGFGLQEAILAFDKQLLMNKADTILRQCPKGKEQIIFIENHDMGRFASLEKNPQKQRLAAGLQLFIGGVPSLYYGQELGMMGKNFNFGNTDGNDIPSREAFDWYASGEGKGTALWYKNTGKWWDNSNFKAHDGISLEEEKKDAHSLFNYYKELIQLRKNNSALSNGEYIAIENDNKNVFSFIRKFKKNKVLVVANLSNTSEKINFNKDFKSINCLFGENKINGKTIELNPYQIAVLSIK